MVTLMHSLLAGNSLQRQYIHVAKTVLHTWLAHILPCRFFIIKLYCLLLLLYSLLGDGHPKSGSLDGFDTRRNKHKVHLHIQQDSFRTQLTKLCSACMACTNASINASTPVQVAAKALHPVDPSTIGSTINLQLWPGQHTFSRLSTVHPATKAASLTRLLAACRAQRVADGRQSFEVVLGSASSTSSRCSYRSHHTTAHDHCSRRYSPCSLPPGPVPTCMQAPTQTQCPK